MCWPKVEIVRRSQKMFGDVHASFNERFVNEEPCGRVRNLSIVPPSDVVAHLARSCAARYQCRRSARLSG